MGDVDCIGVGTGRDKWPEIWNMLFKIRVPQKCEDFLLFEILSAYQGGLIFMELLCQLLSLVMITENGLINVGLSRTNMPIS